MAGFLDLRYRKYLALRGFQDRTFIGWKEVGPKFFGDFIKWTGDSMEMTVQSSQASYVDRVIQAIRNTNVVIDSSTGGIPIEIAWGQICTECSEFSFESLSREEFERLKSAIESSLSPKGGERKARHFVKSVFDKGPGKFRYKTEVPRGSTLMDWYNEMADEANNIQQHLMALRQAEGEVGFDDFPKTITIPTNINRSYDISPNNPDTHQQRNDYPPRQDDRNNYRPNYPDQKDYPQYNTYNDPPDRRYQSFTPPQRQQTNNQMGGEEPLSRSNPPAPGTPVGYMPRSESGKLIPVSTGDPRIQRDGYEVGTTRRTFGGRQTLLQLSSV